MVKMSLGYIKFLVNTVKFKKTNKEFKKLCKQLGALLNDAKTHYSSLLEQYSRICELENIVAKLSNSATVRVLDYTLKQIADMSMKPYSEVLIEYLEEAVKDLTSGMDAFDMIMKYDRILYGLKNNDLKT